MRLYLDASVLIPLFIEEAGTARAEQAIAGREIVVSDFAAAEFSSGVARRARQGEIDTAQSAALFAAFDTWVVQAAWHETTTAADLAAAMVYVRQVELGLRTPDAINIAIARRCDAEIISFDSRMAAAATLLGMAVIS